MPRFMHNCLSALGLAVALAGAVQASVIERALPGAELRGESTFRFVGVPLYKARLFTHGGAPLDWSRDFALELTYLRYLSGADLVESTLRELERLGGAPPVRGQLERCFRDVRRGDSYAAVSKGPDRIGFWNNGQRVCTLSHPGIKGRFMAIFLGPDTRSASFTRRLKGE
ncbi:hypothetical protein [Leisingera sp. McT4-56]|uniref:hypothetical protein n=1 Tax=Leisingera sp. McT4-56 TaxID=2881255 RepID=UPI001CF8DF92|nr:hypothetical protein [Leisingera sp. McT4-56]MCB4455710.1 hypothetical protein [Leisingera sp. McT4-56]